MHEIDDIAFAAFLRIKGGKLKGFRPGPGFKGTFIFEKSQNIEKLTTEYLNDGAVSCKAFQGEIRCLKALIDSETRKVRELTKY